MEEAIRFVEGNDELARALGVEGPEELAVHPLAQGEHNVNFLLRAGDGRRFVLRINYASQLGLADQIGYEYGALRADARAALCGRHPPPHRARRSGGELRGGLVDRSSGSAAGAGGGPGPRRRAQRVPRRRTARSFARRIRCAPSWKAAGGSSTAIGEAILPKRG